MNKIDALASVLLQSACPSYARLFSSRSSTFSPIVPYKLSPEIKTDIERLDKREKFFRSYSCSGEGVTASEFDIYDKQAMRSTAESVILIDDRQSHTRYQLLNLQGNKAPLLETLLERVMRETRSKKVFGSRFFFLFFHLIFGAHAVHILFPRPV